MKIKSFSVKPYKQKPFTISVNINFDKVPSTNIKSEIRFKIRSEIQKILDYHNKQKEETLYVDELNEKELSIREASILLNVPIATIRKWRRDPLLQFPHFKKYGITYYIESQLIAFREQNPALFSSLADIIYSREVAKILNISAINLFKLRTDPSIDFPVHSKTNSGRILYDKVRILEFKEKYGHLL